jgi:hypothetical protein
MELGTYIMPPEPSHTKAALTPAVSNVMYYISWISPVTAVWFWYRAIAFPQTVRLCCYVGVIGSRL